MNSIIHSAVDQGRAQLDNGLDRLEGSLPEPMRAPLKLQRTIARNAAAATRSGVQTAYDSMKTILDSNIRAGRTVAGTAEWALSTTGSAAKTLLGQTKAQVGDVRDTTSGEVADLASKANEAGTKVTEASVNAVDAVEVALSAEHGATLETYEDLTRDELYRRAKSLDIEGRSAMSKDELIDAIRSA